jgi:general stress protein 26
MRTELSEIAPRFVEMAHGIGIAVAATVDRHGQPHTRVMQPVWEWDGERISGWVSTVTTNPKVDDLRNTPSLSFTYWHPDQDTCSADCDVRLVEDPAEKAVAWERFKATAPPAGFDPAIHPDWESAESPTFGVLEVSPRWLRVMPGTLMLSGTGDVLTWSSVGDRSPAST